MVMIEPDNARAVADFHTAFNLLLALIFFPLLKPYAYLLRRMLPAQVNQADPGRPIYLDPAARETPIVAIGGAAREALRLADVVESMLVGLREAFAKGDRRQISETRRLDDILDKLNTAIKAYITVDRSGCAERRRSSPCRGSTDLHHQYGTCRRHRRKEPAGDRHQKAQAWGELLKGRTGRTAGDDRPASGEPPHGRVSVHDGG